MARNPEAAQYIGKMDKIRQEILEAEYRDTWRNLSVTYIFGPTATGKTRGVMEKHGYGSVYRVTDYNHPFDRYAQEPVLCLDEYRSSLLIGDMLDYLDGYPLALPARYANRQACYETVYIISNIDLKEQYPNIQGIDFDTKQHLGTVVTVAITEDQTVYKPGKDGKAISNLYEKMAWKVKRDINIPVGVQVEPVEGEATIYGEYRNELSVKVADIKVIQPTSPVSGGKG